MESPTSRNHSVQLRRLLSPKIYCGYREYICSQKSVSTPEQNNLYLIASNQVMTTMKFRKNFLPGLYLSVLILSGSLPFGWAQEKNTAETESSQTEPAQATTQQKLENILSQITRQVSQPADSTATKTDNIEIDGLIIDQTLTKIGHEFYEYFYALWQAPSDIKNFTIFISEKTTMSSTSLIWIEVHEMKIYENVLKPRTEEIEEAAQLGIEATQQFLFQYTQDQKQLGGEDMRGTGIF